LRARWICRCIDRKRAGNLMMAEKGPDPVQNSDLEYAGFWIRAWASVIDSVLVCIIVYPVLTGIYGWGYWGADGLVQGPLDFLVSWIGPAIAIVLFWVARQATPGKMAISARIVDAKTGAKPSAGQLVVRYLGYYVSMIPLFLGILWIAFDPRKQGWHDKLAGTVVVRKRSKATAPVRFEGASQRPPGG
jgi:uncharacterized RDD family membrane protein YckC